MDTWEDYGYRRMAASDVRVGDLVIRETGSNHEVISVGVKLKYGMAELTMNAGWGTCLFPLERQLLVLPVEEQKAAHERFVAKMEAERAKKAARNERARERRRAKA